MTPLAQIYGIPLVGFADFRNDPDKRTGTANSQLSISGNLASVSNQFREGGERGILDGESLRLDINYQRTLPTLASWIEKWHLHNPRLQLNLPLIHHGQGFFDSSVETFHDWFGLPNGNRGLRPSNALLYTYSRNGQQLLNFQNEQTGIGDTSLGFAVTALTQRYTHRRLDIAFNLKLPSGDANKLTGSGGTDFSTSLTLINPLPLQKLKLEWSASAYYIRLSRSGPLRSILKRELLAARAIISWQKTEKWQLFTRLDYHQALYLSDLRSLGEDTLAATFGVTRKLPNGSVAFYLGEDLFIDNSQDFSLATSWTRRW